MIHNTVPRVLAKAIFAGSLTASLITGCATSDITTEDTVALADSPAAFDTDKSNWETPFWERGTNASENPKQRPDTAVGEAPLANIGFTLSSSINDGEKLVQTLYHRASQEGLRPLPGGLVAETLESTETCQDRVSISDSCAASLAHYPGIRMLVAVTSADDGSGLSADLYDTSLAAHYRVEQLANSEAGAQTLLDEISRRVAMAPWSTRAFEGEDGSLYISASQVNGLNQGQQLAVREPGTAVKAPSGQIVAFRPGKRVGTLEVVEFVGDYLAIVKTVSGDTPAPRHWVTLPTQS